MTKKTKPVHKSNFSIGWKIIAAVCIIIGGIASYIVIKNEYRTDKEKFDSEHLVQGELKPNKITNNPYNGYTILDKPPNFNLNVNLNSRLPKIKGILLRKPNAKMIIFGFGHVMVAIDMANLYKGIRFDIPYQSSCGSESISFGINDGRVYTSVKFNDLVNDECIGWIEYNHWNVYKEQLIEYPKSDDDRLEVRDKRHNIVFSIRYHLAEGDTMDSIFINGYFKDFSSISVLSSTAFLYKKKDIDTCIPLTDMLWKQKSIKLIDSIATIFPYGKSH